MLQSRVLALGVLTDDAQIDVLVARGVARNILDKHNARIDIEFLPQRDIEALVSAALKRRVQDTLQPELIPLQAGNGLAEQLLGVLVARLDAGDVHLLPLDGHVVRLEDGLDGLRHLGTDAITGDERGRVLAAELCRLEDVALHGCVGAQRGWAGERRRLGGGAEGRPRCEHFGVVRDVVGRSLRRAIGVAGAADAVVRAVVERVAESFAA